MSRTPAFQRHRHLGGAQTGTEAGIFPRQARQGRQEKTGEEIEAFPGFGLNLVRLIARGEGGRRWHRCNQQIGFHSPKEKGPVSLEETYQPPAKSGVPGRQVRLFLLGLILVGDFDHLSHVILSEADEFHEDRAVAYETRDNTVSCFRCGQVAS